MRGLIRWIAIQWSALRDRLLVRRVIAGSYFGPLLIDRGRGFLYDVERDLTWLQDTNYARTTGRSSDGQMTWDEAKAWVARLIIAASEDGGCLPRSTKTGPSLYR